VSEQATIILQAILSGLMIGFIFSLVSAGLSLIWGVMDLVNFAHGDFLMLAMYSTYWAFVLLGMDPLFFTPLNTLLLFIVGALVYRFLIQRIIDAAKTAQTFATFGLMVILRAGAQFVWSGDYRAILDSSATGQIWIPGGVSLGRPQLLAAIGAVLSSAFLYWLIQRTELGRALQAVAEDKAAASLMGIDSQRMYTVAWGIGLACVGVAGALLSTHYYIFPTVGLLFGQMALVTVAMGGFGNIPGTFIAGVINGLVMVVSGLVLGPAFKYLGPFALYLVVVLGRAWGLFGKE
jgi:branched-chain amino acid transport system permease protein